MTLEEICGFVKTAAEVASFLGVPYASDVVAAASVAPEIIADAKDAISRVESLFSPSGPVALAIAPLEAKHIDAIQTVHKAFSTYTGQPGHNMHSPVPGQVILD